MNYNDWSGSKADATPEKMLRLADRPRQAVASLPPSASLPEHAQPLRRPHKPLPTPPASGPTVAHQQQQQHLALPSSPYVPSKPLPESPGPSPVQAPQQPDLASLKDAICLALWIGKANCEACLANSIAICALPGVTPELQTAHKEMQVLLHQMAEEAERTIMVLQDQVSFVCLVVCLVVCLLSQCALQLQTKQKATEECEALEFDMDEMTKAIVIRYAEDAAGLAGLQDMVEWLQNMRFHDEVPRSSGKTMSFSAIQKFGLRLANGLQQQATKLQSINSMKLHQFYSWYQWAARASALHKGDPLYPASTEATQITKEIFTKFLAELYHQQDEDRQKIGFVNKEVESLKKVANCFHRELKN